MKAEAPFDSGFPSVTGHAATSGRRRAIESTGILLILLAAVVISFLLYWHLYFNGSRFHRFTWHRAPLWTVLPIIYIAALPVFAIELLPLKLARPAIVLPILTLTCFGLEVASSALQWNALSLAPFVRDVQSPLATSYFNDAQDLIAHPIPMREFLGSYPARMPSFHYHAQNKGPLPILYYYAMLRLFPDLDTAALAGALLIGALGALAIPASWYMIRTLTAEGRSALEGAAYFTVMPALLILLPEFDLVYVPLTALLIAFWWQAIATGKARYAVLAALSISITCLFAFNTLIIGTFLIAITLLHPPSWQTLLRQLIVAIAVTAGFYLLLYALWGYNPIATLIQAWHDQNVNLKSLHRPWPNTVPTDLTKFLVSLGWLPVIVLLVYFARRQAPHRVLAILCIAQPIFVAATGLLQSESHRLWLFMTPLIVLPVGLEIARWPRHYRITLIACQTLVLAFLTESLRFH